jgi:hypothetical protein
MKSTLYVAKGHSRTRILRQFGDKPPAGRACYHNAREIHADYGVIGTERFLCRLNGNSGAQLLHDSELHHEHAHGLEIASVPERSHIDGMEPDIRCMCNLL